jgi:predicted dehydrogenase
MKRSRIGVIGCGNISSAYLRACKMFDFIEVAACADLDLTRAKDKAKEHGIARACSTQELLADPSIDIVINLTIPRAHAEIAIAALESGKSVHGEKPFAITREEGKRILALAKQKNLRVGSAPDTFLGAGIQTCRKLIDDGAIGAPVAATAFMLCHGHESWHPSPEFYYQVGGGPMFDMGPYYLTALVALLGPVRRASGATRITFPERTITSQPKSGTKVKVEVPTHVAGVLEFGSGAIGTIVTSFDVWSHNAPTIEIYGTEGTLSVPDPNGFGGPVRLRRAQDKEAREVALTHGYADNSRGIGAADMAHAIAQKRPHRCSGELAYHVLDCMHAIHDAARTGRYIELESTCDRPAALSVGLAAGQIELG